MVDVARLEIQADATGITAANRALNRMERLAGPVGRAVKRLGARFKGLLKSVFSLKTAIATLVGSAGLGLLVSRQLAAIDSTAKFADMIGETTQDLVGLQHAAEITAGVTGGQFNMALQRMTRRLAEAANGTGEAKDAIKQLGLDAQELSKMGPAAAFQEISAAMQDIDSQGQRVRVAFKLFDSEGAKLVNTLNAGPEAIRELIAEADTLGRSFDRVDAAKIEAANDAITRSRAAFSGVARTLTVQLAPYIEAVANQFVASSKDANGFKDVVIGAVEGAAKAVGFLGDMFRGIRTVIKTVEVGFAMFAEGMYQSILDIVESARALANAIPYIEIGPIEGLESVARAATIRTNELKGELEDLVSEEMPSHKIDAFFDKVKRQAEESALAVSESKKVIVGSPSFDEVDKLGSEMDDLQRAIEGWGRQSSKAFADFVTSGKASFSDLIDSMINDMIQMMAYKNIFGPLFSTIGLMGTGAAGYGAMAGGAAGAIPGRANGGPVGSGRMYEVNERGPEMLSTGGRDYLMMGSQAGNVSPIKGGGGSNVNVNIINNTESQITTSERRDSQGGTSIEVMIDNAVAQKMSEFGSSTNKALRNGFGAKQRLASR